MKNKSFTVLLLTIIAGILFNFLILGCETETPPISDPWVAEYTVGDTGPAGGLVFYVSRTGFTVDGLSGKFHYLEASLVEVSSFGTANWGGNGTSCGNSATGIGTGYNNTIMLLDCDHVHPSDNPNAHLWWGHPVARAVWDYSVTNNDTIFDDWWLPSKDELNELYKAYASLSDKTGWPTNRTGYWSSSEYDENNMWVQRFGNANADPVASTDFSGAQFSESKGYEYRNRAVRAF